ncbi:hypothetical protein [Microvirga arabica]|uniref:hypothetical protein n=1 Tax=Microvirga arabica TaxID=1128671 RepID=UPI001FEAE850|nr:hypothetical protein [Microvirga arabica]
MRDRQITLVQHLTALKNHSLQIGLQLLEYFGRQSSQQSIPQRHLVEPNKGCMNGLERGSGPERSLTAKAKLLRLNEHFRAPVLTVRLALASAQVTFEATLHCHNVVEGRWNWQSGDTAGLSGFP